MNRTLIRRSAGAAAIALVLAGAGCAKKSDDLSIGSSFAELDSQKVPGPGGDVTSTTAGKGSAPGGKVGKIQPSATAKFVKESAQRTRDANVLQSVITVDAGELSTSMDIAIDVKAEKMKLNMVQAGQEIQMILNGNDMYMKAPGLLEGMSALNGGKEVDWIKISDPSLAKSFTESQGSGGLAAGFNAQSYLNGMLGAGGTVEDLGTEEVDGVTTHHYRGSINSSTALSEQADSLTAEEQQSLESSLGDTDIPVEVWIDDEGLVRKLLMEMDGAAYGVSGTVTMTMELKNVGEPVEIEIPDESKVFDMTSFAGGNLGGLGSGSGDDPLKGFGLPEDPTETTVPS